MKTLVVTNCTNRKQLSPPLSLQARSLPSGDPRGVAEEWWARVEQGRDRLPAREMYKGRTFAEALRAADALGSAFSIVSAGLGLVNDRQLAPAYSLTIAPGSADTILTKANCTAGAWWRALAAVKPPSSWPVADLTLLALSRPYLAMVTPDLAAWSTDRRSRLRIFSGARPEEVDPVLREQLMPYDARLDARGGLNPGTQADFAQRAMRHFAEKIMVAAPHASAAAHAAAVDAALSAFTARDRPNRTKLSDEAIINLIGEHWTAVDGRSGLMLRYLRDRLDVACEQSRFKALFKTAASQNRLL